MEHINTVLKEKQTALSKIHELEKEVKELREQSDTHRQNCKALARMNETYKSEIKELMELAEKYGEFSVRCDREKMHILTFEGFLELLNKLR